MPFLQFLETSLIFAICLFLAIIFNLSGSSSYGNRCPELHWWGSSGQELLEISQMPAPRNSSGWLFLPMSKLQKMGEVFFLHLCQSPSQCPVAIIIKSEVSQSGYLHTTMRITKTKTAWWEGRSRNFTWTTNYLKYWLEREFRVYQGAFMFCFLFLQKNSWYSLDTFCYPPAQIQTESEWLFLLCLCWHLLLAF